MEREEMNSGKYEQADPRLGQWLDGELPEEQRTEVESLLDCHVQDRKVVEDYRALGTWLRRSHGLERVEPDAEVFWNRLRGRLPERRSGWTSAWQSLQQLWIRPRYQLAFAAVAVLVVVGLVFFNRSGIPVDIPPADLSVAAGPGCVVESVETGVPGASLMVYHSEREDLTVVWLFAENTGDGSMSTFPNERQT